MGWLKGKKSHIVAAMMVLISILDMLTGDASFIDVLQGDNLQLLLQGLGLSTLRAGISKVEK